MSETILGILIGGAFGFLGALLGAGASVWAQKLTTRHARLQQIRQRVVGEGIQTSEVMELIKFSRKREWPVFWKYSASDLSKADLPGVDLRFQNLKRVKFYSANLERADFYEADLRLSDLARTRLNKAELSRSQLDNTKLYKSDLTLAKLRGATIKMSNLYKSTLVEADLGGADLEGANLNRANLEKANLEEANLKGADLRGTNLLKAKLSKANLDQIKYDENTIWPDGFVPSTQLADLKTD